MKKNGQMGNYSGGNYSAPGPGKKMTAMDRRPKKPEGKKTGSKDFKVFT